jgi:hypothetical protein
MMFSVTMKAVLATATLMGFADARKLWTSEPAVHGDYVMGKPYLMKTAYPLGNGRLGCTYQPVGCSWWQHAEHTLIMHAPINSDGIRTTGSREICLQCRQPLGWRTF